MESRYFVVEPGSSIFGFATGQNLSLGRNPDVSSIFAGTVGTIQPAHCYQLESRTRSNPFFNQISSQYKYELLILFFARASENKMQPTNPNAHTYVNGTDVKAHGYAVTHTAFLQWFI
jgi:hypothetical protein